MYSDRSEPCGSPSLRLSNQFTRTKQESAPSFREASVANGFSYKRPFQAPRLAIPARFGSVSLMARQTSGRAERGLKVRVTTARRRKSSSTRWLERQLNDPYVRLAKAEGYRGRAAYKLIEIDDKHQFLKPGARVLDLGSAPGGWCQVAARRVNTLGEQRGNAAGRVIGIDIKEVDPIPGAEVHVLDFLSDGADDRIRDWLGDKADVVMSDMAANSTGHRQTDHVRIMALCEAAADLAFDVLDEGGTFVAKVLAGGPDSSLQVVLKRRFGKVVNMKPPASRADSREKYVVATGFRAERGQKE